MKDTNTSSPIRNIKNQHFDNHTYEDWLIAAENTLKTSLSNYYRTYESIQLNPLYTKKDSQKIGHLRTSNQANWKITQNLTAKSSEELNQELLQAIDFGLETVSFSLDSKLNIDELQTIFSKIDLANYPFFINGNMLSIPFYLLLDEYCEKKQFNKDHLTGFIGSDPFQSFVENALSKEEALEYYQFWAKGILKADDLFPNVNSVYINTTIYEKAGASIIQQLAFSLSVLVEHMDALVDEGMEVERAFQKMVLGFSIGTDFFMEIAKLRAAKYLWYKIQEAYEIKEQVPPTIYAETTTVNKSAIEPYMNILRTGGEALAAVIGQIDYLQIGEFDELAENNSRLGKRISINIHHLLREEARLNFVTDPARGSYYVESLTKSFIEKAWELFLTHQEKGSFYDRFVSGSIQVDLEEKKNHILNQFNYRKLALVGANRFVDTKAKTLNKQLNEVLPLKLKKLDIKSWSLAIKEGKSLADFVEKGLQSDESIKPLLYFRITEELEEIRAFTSSLEKPLKPVVGLITFGDYKKTKAVIDFVTDLLAAGGIDIDVFESNNSIDHANQFIDTITYPFYCYIDDSDVIDASIIRKLTSEHHDKKWLIASLSEVKDLENEYFYAIYPGMNHIQFLLDFMAVLKGEKQ